MEHYFSKKPTSVLKIEEIKAEVNGKEYKLLSGSGMFSIKRLDDGSKLLIENAIVKEKDKVLDLGCGYGAVGVIVKDIHPKCEVVMTDINERAVDMAKRNAKMYGFDMLAVSGDKFESVKEKDFDVILFNPPQTAGKQICLDMIKESKEYLREGGILQIVARHNKGGRSLSAYMEEIFGNVKDIAKKKGYRVYISRKE